MKNKKITEQSRIKRVFLSFWFWVIVAIISHFIFASIPITWDESGFGWDTFAGLNFLKTILAYFTQIAWIVAFVMLIIKGIKYIQKTKINDYWKISLTILGIIFIIVFIFFSVKDFSIFHSSNPDAKVKEMLEEEGYEVIDVNYIDLSDLDLGNETKALVKMKSLGNINEQVWNALSLIGIYYKDADEYIITILTPTGECFYSIDGNLYRNYKKATDVEKIVINGTEYDVLTIYSYLKSEIDKETKRCS